MTRGKLAWISGISLVFAGLGLAAGAPFGILTRTEPIGGILMLSMINLTFFGIVGMAVWLGSGVHARLVDWRILRFYGNISYGLYLYHWLIFMTFDWARLRFGQRALTEMGRAPALFLRLTIVVAVATALSYVSRWYFEERFLKLKLRPA